jgi:hypothetical protein
MHGIVINVLINVDQTKSILPRLPRDNVVICVFLNQHLTSNHLICQEIFFQIWRLSLYEI